MYRKMPPWIAQREGIRPHDLRRLVKDPTLPMTPPSWPRGVYATVGHKDAPEASSGDVQWVGGIDFGFRNPFAAIWGVLDADGVLWLMGEHYQRQRPLSHHMLWWSSASGAVSANTSMSRCTCPASTANRHSIGRTGETHEPNRSNAAD